MPRRTDTPAAAEIQAATEENTAASQEQAVQTLEQQADTPESAAVPESAASSAPPMKIDVRITGTRNVYGDPTRASATVTLNDVFAIKGVLIKKGENGLFCSMPARRLNNGSYSDVCNPITKDFALQLNASVLNEYQLHLHQQMEESMQMPHVYEPEQEIQEPETPQQGAPAPEMGMM